MIINKTPHPVNIVDGPTFPACPKDELIRLRSETVADAPIDGVPTSRTIFGEPEGLPEPSWECPVCGGVGPHVNFNGVTPCCEAGPVGVFFIISQIIKSACPDRDDLLVPAEVVRDSAGNIIGCRSLGR